MTMSGIVGGLRPFRAQAITRAKIEPEIDEAGRSLQALARGVVLRAHEIIEECTAASHGQVEFRGYTDVADIADRAWRVRYDRRETFCVVNEASERMLLGWIVGGRPSVPALSSIERSIVEESLRRMLSIAASAPLELEHEPRIRPRERSWRCDVHLSGGHAERATIQLFTECALTPQPKVLACHPDIREVGLQLRAALPGVACALSDVWEWRSGSVLMLQRPDRDISVGLYAGGHRVALAQLGTVFGDRAVKLVALGSHARR
jgi:Type III flagellar switch regulator (C-ring) FliN C-term